MLKDYGGTVIMVSHNRDEIYRFSEDLLVMEAGRVSRFGRCRDIFADPGRKAAAGLTGCKNFSRVRRIDRHHLEAEDFGIILHTDREVPENAAYIGYRAHEFVPVWGAREENCIKVQVESAAELPFEKKYYLLPEKDTAREQGSGRICWFVQKDKWPEMEKRGLPDYLKFAEAHILFLEE